METSTSNSPYFKIYQAAQVKLNDKGFLSRDITVHSLILNCRDIHHLYPKNFLKKQGINRGLYNQIANFVLTQSEINIAIGDQSPDSYFKELRKQCTGGKKRYGGITSETELRENLRKNCVPETLLEVIPEYEEFLKERRYLMAQKIKTYFNQL
jgi:hypothetical protein